MAPIVVHEDSLVQTGYLCAGEKDGRVVYASSGAVITTTATATPSATTLKAATAAGLQIRCGGRTLRNAGRNTANVASGFGAQQVRFRDSGPVARDLDIQVVFERERDCVLE